MQVNMLEAKNQLSKLVKAALAGEDVVIASHGEPQVRLVPLKAEAGLHQAGTLRSALDSTSLEAIDAAFSEATDAEVHRLMQG
jgi:prevent-host-death family protein